MKHSSLCKTKFCRAPRAPGRTVCHKCRARAYRQRNPIVALYHRCKSHAKQRGIAWLLTPVEFAAFCADTGYHILKGRTAECASIDRIRGDLPYQYGNIQLKTVGENSAKSYWDGAREKAA